MKLKVKKDNKKKKIYKKWWFWLIVVFCVGIIGSFSTDDEATTEKKKDVVTEEKHNTKKNETSKEEDDITFTVSNVRNDVTGNWRISLIAENIEMQDHALDYYKKYFKSDDEIHAIVNFNYKTTTKISVIGNLLDVSVYEYVDKEEHDAKLLFSGSLLKEYHINKDTGDIEEII